LDRFLRGEPILAVEGPGGLAVWNLEQEKPYRAASTSRRHR
jgi:hypothetical protein